MINKFQIKVLDFNGIYTLNRVLIFHTMYNVLEKR